MCISGARCNASRGPSRRGFTILELLIVIGIIAVLAAMLIPAVRRIKEQARTVLCQNNVKVLMQGILAFSVDHDSRLVGNIMDTGDPDPSHRDFLYGTYAFGGGNLGYAPQNGTLFPYVGYNYNTYLCPSLQAMPGFGNGTTTTNTSASSLVPGLTTNGRFDYAIFCAWDGARINKIPPTAQMYYPNGTFDTLPTPIIVQEAANSINGAWMEGAHDHFDAITHIHFGGGYYASVDGSVHFVIEPPSCPGTTEPCNGAPGNIGAYCWRVRTPSGATIITLAACPPGVPNWGWWDHQ